MFPFKYEGNEYTSCITDGNDGTKWCATSLDAGGSYLGYGNCSPDCDEEDKPGMLLALFVYHKYFPVSKLQKMYRFKWMQSFPLTN